MILKFRSKLLNSLFKKRAISPGNAVNSLAPDDARCVLVGTTKGPAQLKCALENRFYHIPAIRLSDSQFPIRYIAIYESLHKFGDKAGIRYFGEVSKCSRVRRCEITEIPKTSDELYYRFDIKEWQKLKTPIAAGNTDIISMSVSTKALFSSSDVVELGLVSEAERLLYSQLKRYVAQDKGSFSFSGADIIIRKGHVFVSKNNSPRFSCASNDFLLHPASIVEVIIKTLN